MAIAFRGHSYFAREGQRRLPSGANTLGFSSPEMVGHLRTFRYLLFKHHNTLRAKVNNIGQPAARDRQAVRMGVRVLNQASRSRYRGLM